MQKVLTDSPLLDDPEECFTRDYTCFLPLSMLAFKVGGLGASSCSAGGLSSTRTEDHVGQGLGNQGPGAEGGKNAWMPEEREERAWREEGREGGKAPSSKLFLVPSCGSGETLLNFLSVKTVE